MNNFQQTIAGKFQLAGVGVHSGQPVTLSVLPAKADNGIVFERYEQNGRREKIPALSKHLGSTTLCTAIGADDFSVSTIEHLMAAISALNIDNLLIEIDGPEVPIMSGGSLEFTEAFMKAGLIAQPNSRSYIKIIEPVRVVEGQAWAEFIPADSTRYEVEIDFDVAVIGRQTYQIDVTAQKFIDEIACARTFGFMRDVEKLRAAGLAQGASLENSVVIGDDGNIINPDGLIFPDEFVRHKLLDAIGDLALAGAPFIGCFRSYRSGHRLNAAAVAALLSRPESYKLVSL